MHIHSIQIQNYKSFGESDEIIVEPEINLITGGNNSGKTALLEALSGRFENKPHRNPKFTDQGDKSPASITNVKYRFTPEDMIDFISQNDILKLPCPNGLSEDQIESLFLNAINEGVDFVIQSSGQNPEWGSTGYFIESTQFHQGTPHSVSIALVNDKPQVNFLPGESTEVSPIESSARDYVKRIFHFKSERIGRYRNSLGQTGNLLFDTANLPEVLHNAHSSNSVRYSNKFIKLVNRVLPNVKFVSPELLASGVGIKIWSEEQTADGPEISVPVEDCGTGVGQVLSMIYVIEYMKPSAIIIDEPSSFLHPGATRELIRIFKENTQHQYFISTHAHEVFREMRPNSYMVLTHEDYETKIERRAADELSDTFDLLGISPFYDCTYWVEGPTEVQAFPYIVNDPGIRFFPILNADVVARESIKKEKIKENAASLKRSEIDRLLRIYQGMLDSISGEVAPAKMRIVVDGEHLEEKYRIDYGRQDKIVKFLPRKMFENYLLHPEAIAHSLNKCSESEVTSDEVQSYLAESGIGENSDTWHQNADGAKILEDLFSKHLCQFRKTEHSVEITKWIMETDPSFLYDLKEYLLGLRNEPIQQKSSTMSVS